MFGILLTLLGIIAIIVFSLQVYRTAADTGRSPVIWTALAACVGFAFQFVLPFFIGIAIGIYSIVSGTPPGDAFNIFGLGFIIEIGCLVLSVIGMVYVSNQVAKIPDDPPISAVSPPPPPPQF